MPKRNKITGRFVSSRVAFGKHDGPVHLTGCRCYHTIHGARMAMKAAGRTKGHIKRRVRFRMYAMRNLVNGELACLHS